MSTARESDIVRTFLALSTRLADGYDVVDLLGFLTEQCAELLDVGSSGLLLADDRGVLHVLAASSERTRQLEIFQLQRDEGPCLDCFRAGTAIRVPDLAAEADRWPMFAPTALAAGFASVHALPMRLRDQVLGTLGLFGNEVGALSDDDLALGQAMADVASIAIVQENAAADRDTVNEQLQRALRSRVSIEQAKGVLAQLGQIDMADAFDRLRSYARRHNLKLTDVAEGVIDRSLSAAVVASAGRVPRD